MRASSTIVSTVPSIEVQSSQTISLIQQNMSLICCIIHKTNYAAAVHIHLDSSLRTIEY